MNIKSINETTQSYEEIKKELIRNSNNKLAEFTAKLCPDTNISQILGIKIPQLRKIAKNIIRNNQFEIFIKESNKDKSKKYVEEVILEGLVIGYSKIDFEEKLKYLKKYIPKINNWLENDTVCSTIKVKNDDEADKLWDFIIPYLKSSNEFEIRFAVVIILGNFITEKKVDEVIEHLDKVKNKEYYVQMAIAWTLAEIGIKFNEKAIKYLKGQNNLDKFTFNKTLQKMRESYRIPAEQKEELKAMRIK